MHSVIIPNKEKQEAFSTPNDEKKTVVESVKEEKECARISRKNISVILKLESCNLSN